MDIPETGAVFTLGESHLSVDHQHFFFIRNDPIRKLVCGDSESAVICKSGRCFVWGDNRYGQLGIGNSTTAIVTKPSCIKEIKSQGLSVKDISFGNGFAVIITDDNKIFLSGKNILSTEKFKSIKKKFTTSDSNTEMSSNKPILIDELITDVEGNDRILFSVSAGEGHFSVLTDHNKLIVCGKHLNRTNDEIFQSFIFEDSIKSVKCGKTFTLILTDKGDVYMVGEVYREIYDTPEKCPEMSQIKVIHVTNSDEIYLIKVNGMILKNDPNFGMKFAETNLIEDIDDKIIEISTGENFISLLTADHRLVTTFPMSGNPNSHRKLLKELPKFKTMNVLQLSSGLNHILVHAIRNHEKEKAALINIVNFSPKKIMADAIFISPIVNGNMQNGIDLHDENLNDLNKTYTKADNKEFVDNLSNNIITSQEREQQREEKDDGKERNCEDFTLYLKRTPTIDSLSHKSLNSEKSSSRKGSTESIESINSQPQTVKKKVKSSSVSSNMLRKESTLEKCSSIKTEEAADSLSGRNSFNSLRPNIGSVAKYTNEIEDFGSDLSNSGSSNSSTNSKQQKEDRIKCKKETPSLKDLQDFEQTSSQEKLDTVVGTNNQTGSYDENEEFLRNERNANMIQRTIDDARRRIDSRRTEIEKELTKDENIKVVKIVDPSKGEIFHCVTDNEETESVILHANGNKVHENYNSDDHHHDIRYIDNGIDVTQSVVGVEERSLKKLDSFKKEIEDNFLGERLPGKKITKIKDVKEDIKVHLKTITEPVCIKKEVIRKTPIPSKRIIDNFTDKDDDDDDDEDDDDDGNKSNVALGDEDDDGKTTASVTSKTGGNPFESDDDDNDEDEIIENDYEAEIISVKNQKVVNKHDHREKEKSNDGFMKQFINELKNVKNELSCKNVSSANAEELEDEIRPAPEEKKFKDSNTDKTSKICTIL